MEKIKLTPEQFAELDKDFKELMQSELGAMFGLMLFNHPDAKNFYKIGFGESDFGGAFDVILRKKESDDKVICPECGNIKIVPTYAEVMHHDKS
jgi:hypothetical protein